MTSRHSRFFRLAMLLAALLAITPALAKAANEKLDDTAATQLMQSIRSLRQGHFNASFSMLQTLVDKHPDFHLAQLLFGQLLAARSGVAAAQLPPATLDKNPQVQELRAEYHARVLGLETGPKGRQTPANILKLPADLPYVVVVDLKYSRLYLLRHKKHSLKIVGNYYVSIGRDGYGKTKGGDLRTPVGIYYTRSWRPGKALAPIYGAGALPLDYPNMWDRQMGHTGSGIWLHGVPRTTYVRAPLATEGCVALANGDLLKLKPYFARHPDTPVILSAAVHWQNPGKDTALRTRIKHDITGWRKAWSQHDTKAYLAYYAPGFHTNKGITRKEFAEYAHYLNTNATSLNIAVHNLALFRYPGDKHVVMAQFTQDYKSGDYTDKTRKTQYWRQQKNGRWKIVLEAEEPLPSDAGQRSVEARHQKIAKEAS